MSDPTNNRFYRESTPSECLDDHAAWREDIAALEADVEMWKQVAATARLAAPDDLRAKVLALADEWSASEVGSLRISTKAAAIRLRALVGDGGGAS